VSTVAASREFFDAAEAATLEEIEAHRWKRVQRVVRYAAAHLPFYQRAFAEAGYTPGPIRSAEEFATRVPRVRKGDLVAAVKDGESAAVGIEALGGRRVSNVVMTSGTQGFNTFAFLSQSDLRGGNLRNAVRELWMAKVRPGMRVLTLSPAWHALALNDTRAITEIGAEIVIPWGSFAPRFVPNFVAAVRRLQPEHILLTAPVLRGLLDDCESLDLPPRDVFRSVRYVACAGESLSPAYRSHVIERMGLEDFFERGGSSDGMFGGAECWAHRGHHIFADLHHIEVVDPRTGMPLPPGRRGSSVVTNLTLGRSIYVRFDTEDVAELIEGPCPCGRTHPLLELHGRLSDSVVLEDRIIAPSDIRFCLDEVPGLLAEPFQVEQLAGNGVRVRLARATVDEDARTGAENLLRTRLDIPVSLEVAQTMAVGWKGQAMRER
jgi:phenylacetate-CoA ligase